MNHCQRFHQWSIFLFRQAGMIVCHMRLNSDNFSLMMWLQSLFNSNRHLLLPTLTYTRPQIDAIYCG